MLLAFDALTEFEGGSVLKEESRPTGFFSTEGAGAGVPRRGGAVRGHLRTLLGRPLVKSTSPGRPAGRARAAVQLVHTARRGPRSLQEAGSDGFCRPRPPYGSAIWSTPARVGDHHGVVGAALQTVEVDVDDVLRAAMCP